MENENQNQKAQTIKSWFLTHHLLAELLAFLILAVVIGTAFLYKIEKQTYADLRQANINIIK